MPDEQLGREWCGRNGLKPEHLANRGRPMFRWADGSGVNGLPHALYAAVVERGRAYAATAAPMYEAVGAALREWQRIITMRPKGVADVRGDLARPLPGLADVPGDLPADPG